MQRLLSAGSVAAITGAAKGIGAGLARELAARKMRLALFDRDGPALERLARSLDADVLVMMGDVTSMEALQCFKGAIEQRFGTVQLLINNVGQLGGAGPWDAPAQWQPILDVNFTSVLASQSLFVPDMIASTRSAAVVNLGSKEGITTPPGHPAYAVAKAGVKVLTEQLAHELLMATQGRVSAHLLVPGYTWTSMNFPGADFDHDSKPEAAWTVDQVATYCIRRLLDEDFYIICPDNEVSPLLDASRMQWGVDDMIQNRPALSRWHPQWKQKFSAWVELRGLASTESK
ncbi:SDR family NAD(P)-dependent oxidoreductase [Frateuria aurantia]